MGAGAGAPPSFPPLPPPPPPPPSLSPAWLQCYYGSCLALNAVPFTDDVAQAVAHARASPMWQHLAGALPPALRGRALAPLLLAAAGAPGMMQADAGEADLLTSIAGCFPL